MTQKQPFGSVMIDVAGLSLTAEEKDKLNHPNTGAVILFSRNYQDPDQVSALIAEIRAARQGDILIAVDQEGGRVQRFQTGFIRLPPAAFFAQHPELAFDAGWLMAAELLAVGVDFSFAPVLDIDCGVSEVIGNRSFSPNPELATRLASDFRAGMKEAGMAATGKHFPGHGAVALDSHLTLPIDERDLETIRAKDLLPFRELIKQGLEAIMPAHVVYPKIAPEAAGFSPFWLQEILRKELGFNGVIFSDDLTMEGAASVGDYPQRAKLALAAGCDMVLVCNNPAAAAQVLESLPISENPLRQQRLETMKGQVHIDMFELQESMYWQKLAEKFTEFTNA
jgi:beta-N-acetylhexosaminidase